MPKAGEPRFVIESTRPARPGIDRQYYRAQPVFQRLYTWLRRQGIKNRCPSHTLRKEFGSLINEKYGLFAAMTALRHSSIAHEPGAIGGGSMGGLTFYGDGLIYTSTNAGATGS
jgi:hypothetical protein